MDASSDAGEVPVDNYSQGIHGHQYKHSSTSRTQWLSGQAANQLAQDSIRFQNDGKDGEEFRPTSSANRFPAPYHWP